MSHVIIPGDSIPYLTHSVPTIGPGIYKSPRTQHIIPLQAGLLKEVPLNKKTGDKLVYIDSQSKRYIPQTNDYVVGIVVGTYSDAYKVSLQESSPPVQLLMVAFPNATKKNRPNLKVGQAVYARVSSAVPEVTPEIECIAPETGKDGGFGPLNEWGYMFSVHMNFARDLLFNKNCVFMEKLASHVAFEIAIGINGRIWLKCGAGLDVDRPPEDADADADVGRAPVSVTYMKTTLAAAKYLMSCQSIPVSEADNALKRAFSGT